MKCASCSQSTDKPLSWLTNRNQMSCPSCNAVINLESGPSALRIQKLAVTCAEIDVSISKLDQSAQ